MSKIRIVLPKIERCYITVSIPMSKKIEFEEGENISNITDFFEKKRKKAKNINQKVELDAVITFLRNAKGYSVKIEKVEYFDKKVEFTLGFNSVNHLIEYKNNMHMPISPMSIN